VNSGRGTLGWRRGCEALSLYPRLLGCLGAVHLRGWGVVVVCLGAVSTRGGGCPLRGADAVLTAWGARQVYRAPRFTKRGKV